MNPLPQAVLTSNGNLHTATVFPPEFAFAAIGGSLSQVQSDCGLDNHRPAGASRWRDHGPRISNQVARLDERRAPPTTLDIKSLRPYSFPFRTTVRLPLEQRCYWFCRCGGVARLDARHRSFEILWRKARTLHGANAAKRPRRRDATEKASAILGYWEAKSAPA